MALGLEKRVLLALILVLFSSSSLQLSLGAVYKVGDSAGWTTIGNVNYKQWAATKTFQIGNVILFQYNPQFHNVMQVTHPEYKACNATSPIATHTTGNDSIIITNHGHHFFLCGVPGHCQAGQKVDINVPRPPSVAPSPSVVPNPTATVTAPAPSPSNAATLYSSTRILGKLGIAVVVFAALFCPFVL
ncbi:hypothetical protein M9H77_35121 [Catharanthus roseus]|uniref:Uncharacterized protein n=1 Tax=Catharanthus roseus TaxID=4058 RepID=A0ACB9ZN43_CATRO|nr:hypothetical protein M9H77_35121 [Catharanthus roseus]